MDALDLDLLIAAPMLQDALIGKDGLPLANGTVTCYKDDSRTKLKNWYYQTGTPLAYQYPALPNPLTLSAAGTICDINGNDTIPFFYPYVVGNAPQITAEPYYIVVKDSNGELQFTRPNFPFLPPAGPTPPGAAISSLDNYIVNNRFWRNFGSVDVGILGSTIADNVGINYVQTGDFGTSYQTSFPQLNYYYVTLAPSQNDGFSMPDYNYIKDRNDAFANNETISFLEFPDSQNAAITQDVQPEFYVNHTCINNVSGASLKAHQFPVALHIGNLIGQNGTFTLQARTDDDTNAAVGIYLYQFLGTGVLSSPPVLIGTLNLTTQWAKYDVPVNFPGDDSILVSSTNDDAWYIQIRMPTSNTFDISFTLPSLYLSLASDIPTNSFQTYDQIDSVISKPRTGDVRTSLNQFYFYGWVPMNNGTIGFQENTMASIKPTARNNKDTWPLYNLIWNLFAPYSTGSSTSGGVNLIAQMYTTGASQVPVAYGPNATPPTTAYGDWQAMKAISLTRSMGRVILGSVPITALISQFKSTFTASQLTSTWSAANVNGSIVITSPLPLAFATAFQFTSGVAPTGTALNTTYYAVPFNATQFYIATSVANAQNDIVIPFTLSAGTPGNLQTFSLILTTPAAIGSFTGQPVIFTNSGGSLPGGLSANVVYYAVAISPTTICVATTFNNAITGNYIAYSSAGSPTSTLYLTVSGAYEGEYTHTQSVSELALHTHRSTTYVGGIGAPTVGAGALVATSTATTPTGNSTPFNITQPGIFNNIYIKL